MYIMRQCRCGGQMERTPRQEHIRNFSIIAHIDHGKSTLADRLLEATSAVAKRDPRRPAKTNAYREQRRANTVRPYGKV